MSDEFVPILAAGVLHAARHRVIIVRDAYGGASTRTVCDQAVTYPGPDWRSAKRICKRCLPDETLVALLAENG